MTVPKENEFKDYARFLRSCHANDIARCISQQMPTDKVALADLVCAAYDELRDKLNSHGTYVVEDWLERQATFEMAEKRAFRIRSNSVEASREEWTGKVTDALHSLIIEHHNKSQNEKGETNRRISNFLRRAFGQPPSARWRLALVKGLIEYHYTDNAAEIASCRKRLPALITNAKQSVNEFLSSIQSQFTKHNNILSFTELEECFMETLHVLETRFPDEVGNRYPIKRDDKTAKERLLVYRMERKNSSLFRSPRPEAISLLLDLEGIRSPLDVRQVEKLCASFKQERTVERQLLSKNKQLSAV